MDRREVNDAIKKLALGYTLSEVIEEYAVEDGDYKLVKKKETKKDVPPDMKALTFLMGGEDLSVKSDEELEREKEELLNMMKESKENE